MSVRIAQNMEVTVLATNGILKYVTSENHLYLVFWLTKRPKLKIGVYKKFGL